MTKQSRVASIGSDRSRLVLAHVLIFLLVRGPGLSVLVQALLARVPWSEGCALCGRDDNPDKTLICDRCDREIHMFCLEPKLKKVRKQTDVTLLSISLLVRDPEAWTKEYRKFWFYPPSTSMVNTQQYE